MKINTTTKILITLVSVVIIIGHIKWPNIIDSITIAFIVIVILAWSGLKIKSIELPFIGSKIELPEIQSATEEVVGTIEASVPTITTSAAADVEAQISKIEQEETVARLRSIAENDPNLALVGVGIEIEKRLRDLAEKRKIYSKGKTAGQLLWTLRDANVLPSAVTSGLRDLLALRNQAAHGAKVSADAAAWVLDVSPSILATLNKLATGNIKEERD